MASGILLMNIALVGLAYIVGLFVGKDIGKIKEAERADRAFKSTLQKLSDAQKAAGVNEKQFQRINDYLEGEIK